MGYTHPGLTILTENFHLSFTTKSSHQSNTISFANIEINFQNSKDLEEKLQNCFVICDTTINRDLYYSVY